MPFNPFLKSFFASRLPTQCSPPSHFVLLVPSVEFILTQTDLDSQLPYVELVQNEDFLASHVIRVPGGLTPINGNQWPNVRESKAKTKQYTTLNGRTLVVKDNFVYSNKGFKSLNQAQLLYDELYQADTPDLSLWLIYHISRPISGMVDVAASKPDGQRSDNRPGPIAESSTAAARNKKDVTSFNDLLNKFPMIARQVHPGLERLFREFASTLERPYGDETSSMGTTLNEDVNDHSSGSGSIIKPTRELTRVTSTASAALSAMGNFLRETLETLVLSAVDLFQSVDKQQLSLLGETTDLSGPAIEQMIERHVTEQVHERSLFPRVRASMDVEDNELESYLKRMANLDISQIGFAEIHGFRGKQDMSKRIIAGVAVFRKMATAGSPQEMLEILMSTQQCLTSSEPSSPSAVSVGPPEEKTSGAAVNADMLVSLLLLVVIRSPVRDLHARLTYIRDFNLFTDVENGQMGYALSTFEGVLAYLSNNSKGLRKISHTNYSLWQAVRKGHLTAVKSLLDPTNMSNDNGRMDYSAVESSDMDDENEAPPNANMETVINGVMNSVSTKPDMLTASNLSHVFPFELPDRTLTQFSPPKSKKRVSMDTRSMSSSSVQSNFSRSSTGTGASVRSMITGETSAAQLSQTQDDAGNSILFMAVESLQPGILAYLLQLRSVITPELVLEYQTNDGTSLLSAAVQRSDAKLVDMVLDYVLEYLENDASLRTYLACQDVNGRSVAHYCFSAPYLISSIGHLLPWQQRDKNGQTPLFAMCRSYDQEDYRTLAASAIAAATKYQGDGGPLQLLDHVDAKGNTLLHIVNDNNIVRDLLLRCNADPNSPNNKRFTPLMVASKFARIDLMRTFFADPRTDFQARDWRGLTAVEVAKDDMVRNQIDDMVLLLTRPDAGQRKTTITRALLVDDGSIRLVIKSGVPSAHGTVTVTTCRRSLADFENLVHWLSLEHPASWIPTVSNFRSPFQIIPRPSKQILRDIQLRLNGFLQAMLTHPPFGTHEMLWEFILVPDIDPRMLAERARRKAEIRVENLNLEYSPLISQPEIAELEIFVGHAIDQLHHTHSALKTVVRRVASVRNASSDIAEAHRSAAKQLAAAAPFVPSTHLTAMSDYAATLSQTEYSPVVRLQYALAATATTSAALLSALARPNSLIGSMTAQRNTIAKHAATLRRTQAWPSAIAGLGLLDSQLRDAETKSAKATREMQMLGRELRYTQTTVAQELAAWQDSHAKDLREALRLWAKEMRNVERTRLVSMQRAVKRVVRDKS